MEALASQLARCIGHGPERSLRTELASLLPGVSELNIRLELSERMYRLVASTPDILAGVSDQWQLRLAQAEDSAAWRPLTADAHNGIDVNGDNAPLQIFTRTITDDLIQLIIPIMNFETDLSSSPSSKARVHPSPLGFVIATASPERILAQPSLQRTLKDLANALSLQSHILKEFSLSIGSALFAAPHSYSDDEDEIADQEDDSSIVDEIEYDLDTELRRNSAENPLMLSPAPSATLSLPLWTLSPRSWLNTFINLWSLPPLDASSMALSAGLSFLDPRQEAAFYAWHSRHMLKYDFAAVSLCAGLHALIVFGKITKFNILATVPAWKWLVGYCNVLLIFIIAFKSTRRWYVANRDVLLLAMLGLMLWYHHYLMRNFDVSGPPVLSRCSGVPYGFLWLPYVTLVYQAQFQWLAPMMTICTAVNLTLLRTLCASCDVDNGMYWKRCIGRGASKVAIMVAAALLTVYCVEWRARRVWAAMRAPGAVRNTY